MFESIKKYFEKRNKEIAAAEYRDGFEWAFGEYLVARMPLSYISDQLWGEGEDNSEFDRGASDAVLVIEDLEAPLTIANERFTKNFN